MKQRLQACLVVTLTSIALAGCSGGGGGGGTSTGTSSPGSGSGSSGSGSSGAFGLTRRLPAPQLNFPVTAPQPASQSVEFARAFPALSFSRPIYLTAAPDRTDRIFVVEQEGRILVFPNLDNVQPNEVRVFLDIRSRVTGGFTEEGLLGLAFDPDFETNGFFYVHYSRSNPRRSRFARFQVSASDPSRANPSSESVFLEVSQPFSNHNGGMLDFGPDGLLYIGLGDGGSGGDPQGNGQNLGSLLGSILRIDVRGFGAQAGYRIPASNPFVGAGFGVRQEIWAFGLRNPWRFSFDRGSGRLWAGDVGQGAREEVDIVVRGGNYGWNVREGSLAFTGIAPASRFIQPVLDYPRSVGRTVIGGYVYRGRQVPGAVGRYLYGDFVTRRIFSAVFNGVSITQNTQIDTISSLSSFGEDRDGELYALSLNGQVFRLQTLGGNPPPQVIPPTLSATGLFANTTSLTPAPGLIEYDVNAPLWSDGAIKRRWLALPGAEQIIFNASGPWTFPVGTVLVKHFELELVAGNPGSRRRLETRVLVHQQSGWAGFVYKWNAAQTDADLLPNARISDTFTITDTSAPGGQRLQTYGYPSRNDCMDCHTAAAGHVLGPRTLQLNGDFDYPAARDNQLRSWNNIGLFTTNIGPHGVFDAHANPSDPSAPIEARARAYLAANCAMCHLPGGPAPGGLDLRSGIPTSSLNVSGVRPSEGSLGLVDAFRVKPGVKESSVLWERVRRRNNVQMPPLATNEVDPVAEDVLGQWIDSGAP